MKHLRLELQKLEERIAPCGCSGGVGTGGSHHSGGTGGSHHSGEMVTHAQRRVPVCVSLQRSSFSWSDAAGGKACSGLPNGSHRAYALREMGITRVPCIVKHVSCREELNVLACTAVTDAPNFSLKEPRPMMLKDYFDPWLRKILPVHKRTRQVTMKFEIDDGFLPAL